MPAKELSPFKEDEPLVVGKMYNVRCAILQYEGITQFVPIIGIAHKDDGFVTKTVPLHYHIDGRFSKAEGFSYDTNGNGFTNKIIYVQPRGGGMSEFKGIVVKRRKCKRLTTGIVPPDFPSLYDTWYASFVGKSCKGKKCPHRGVPMIEYDGKLICPLHNLQGCKKTGKIIYPINTE